MTVRRMAEEAKKAQTNMMPFVKILKGYFEEAGASDAEYKVKTRCIRNFVPTTLIDIVGL